MAKFHTTLKYHEDEVEKVDVTKEDIQFLLELQKEMNTQDNCGTANPRYWSIKGFQRVYHVEDGEADGYEIYDSNSCETIGETMEEVVEYIKDNGLLDEFSENTGFDYVMTVETNLFGAKSIMIRWVEDQENMERELSTSSELIEWFEELGYSEYQAINYSTISKIYENAVFLTEKDAADHLRANAHHYDENAHTYCLCGLRSPRFERVVKLLQTLNFEKMLENM